MLDTIIKGCLIADGSGAPLFRSDIGILDGKIAKIAPELSDDASEIIDGTGLIAAPGFIDAHSHNDMTILNFYTGERCLEQGITSEIAGHCGDSIAPFVKDYFNDPQIEGSEGYGKYAETDGTFSSFIELLSKHELPINSGFMVGHSKVRGKVMGFADRIPTNSEMEEMKSLIREAMDSGAFGMTTGLIYPPGVYASDEEVRELAKVLGEYKGAVYASHMRNESNHVVDSVKETITAGAEAGAHIQISHHKVMGGEHAGLSRETLKLINDAHAKGINVTLDAYPYDGGCTALINALPPEFATEGPARLVEKLEDPEFRSKVRAKILEPEITFENLIRFSGPDGIILLSNDEKYRGKTVAEIAKERNCDPYELMFDLIVESRGTLRTVFRLCSEPDMIDIIRHPFCMIGTDATPDEKATAASHPRGQAAFPHFLSFFCKENSWLSIEEGIRKITSLPAMAYGIENKGLLKEGYDADIVVLDYAKLSGNAAYGKADIPNEGIETVLVNGKVAVRNGKATGIKAGRLLLRRN